LAGVIGGHSDPSRATAASGIVEEPGAFFAEMLARFDLAEFVGTYVVLVNANNRYNAADGDMVAQVRRLYLRDEAAWPDSFEIDPFRRLGGSDVQKAFRALVLGMTPEELGAHWRRLNAASGEAPPKVFVQSRDLVRAVARHEGGLGVVAAWEVKKLPAKVRVLFEFSARERPDGATVSVERLFWEAIKKDTDPARFETYLSKFSDGVFADLARARLGEIAVTAPAEAIETALLAPPAHSFDGEWVLEIIDHSSARTVRRKTHIASNQFSHIVEMGRWKINISGGINESNELVAAISVDRGYQFGVARFTSSYLGDRFKSRKIAIDFIEGYLPRNYTVTLIRTLAGETVAGRERQPAQEVETASVDPTTPSVQITEKEILESKQLRQQIKNFYDDNPFERNPLGSILGFRNINEIRILEISGNQAQLYLVYETESIYSGLKRAIVTVEKAGSTFRVLDMQRWQGN